MVVTARRQPLLDELVAEIRAAGGEAVACAGDIRDGEFHERLVERSKSEFGGLDIAFNNAGILGELKGVPELPITSWEQTINTNLTSAFLAARCQIPALQARGGGSLIFTSTFVGHTTGMAGMAAYAAAKAGLIGLTKVLAAEYGREAIRVNALLPGGTDTPMAGDFADNPAALEYVSGLHALGRIAAPDEIARSALYLASDASSFYNRYGLAGRRWDLDLSRIDFQRRLHPLTTKAKQRKADCAGQPIFQAARPSLLVSHPGGVIPILQNRGRASA